MLQINAITLELKHYVYGFEKEGQTFEDIKQRDDVGMITSERLQAVVWEQTGEGKLVKWIGEIDLRDFPMDKALRKLKNLSKKEGVTNVRTFVKFIYGGRVERF